MADTVRPTPGRRNLLVVESRPVLYHILVPGAIVQRPLKQFGLGTGRLTPARESMSTPFGSFDARDGLFLALAIVTVVFVVFLMRALRAKADAGESVRPTGPITVVSFVANFFDTLGIGSFATTTSMIRQWRLVPDEKIPGTLNVGYV